MTDIRVLLRKAIDTSGLKRVVVAERSNLTPAQLCDILNLRRKLEANEMFDICDAIQITPEQLRDEKSA